MGGMGMRRDATLRYATRSARMSDETSGVERGECGESEESVTRDERNMKVKKPSEHDE